MRMVLSGYPPDNSLHLTAARLWSEITLGLGWNWRESIWLSEEAMYV
jgi:hypothetical protein